jgi:hypothetical protein
MPRDSLIMIHTHEGLRRVVWVKGAGRMMERRPGLVAERVLRDYPGAFTVWTRKIAGA